MDTARATTVLDGQGGPYIHALKLAEALQAAATPVSVANDIGGLTVSATYQPLELANIRDACEALLLDTLEAIVLLNQLRQDLIDAGVIKGSAA